MRWQYCNELIVLNPKPYPLFSNANASGFIKQKDFHDIKRSNRCVISLLIWTLKPLILLFVIQSKCFLNFSTKRQESSSSLFKLKHNWTLVPTLAQELGNIRVSDYSSLVVNLYYETCRSPYPKQEAKTETITLLFTWGERWITNCWCSKPERESTVVDHEKEIWYFLPLA